MIEPHQQRVIDEKEQLDDKRMKLKGFLYTPLYSSLPEAERERLAMQCQVMDLYSDILKRRIACFATGSERKA